ncbi:MAG: hypothetical protein WBP93_21135 [Pyrinomonadaceae bacterium]
MLQLTDVPYGLIELDAVGTVIRYSPAREQRAQDARSIVGQNFFNEVAPFAEVKELKSRFLSFMAFGDAIQRFTIKVPLEEQGIKIQILLARITEQTERGRERLALVRLMPDADVTAAPMY